MTRKIWISKTVDGERIIAQSRYGMAKGQISQVEIDTITGNVIKHSNDLTPGEGEFVHLVKAARIHCAT